MLLYYFLIAVDVRYLLKHINFSEEYFQSRAVAGNGNAFQQNCVSKEQKLTEALKKSLPGITYVSVQDISGGCGAMFEVYNHILNI